MNSHLLKLSVRLLTVAELLSACGGAPTTAPGVQEEIETQTTRVETVAPEIADTLAPAPVPQWWVATASGDKTARVWDAASGETVAVLQGHTEHVLSAAFSPDGKWVVTSSNDKTARVWEAATGRSVAVLSGHEIQVVDAVFSPDGKVIATSGGDRTVRIWDAASGKAVLVLGTASGGGLDPAPVTTASFSPDGKLVAAAPSGLGPVTVWDVATGTVTAEYRLKGGIWFDSVAFSPNGQFIVIATGWPGPDFVGTGRTTYVWEPQTGITITEFAGHSDAVNEAAFSPDSQWVVTASADHTAQVWEAATGEVIAVLSGHAGSVYSADFSPDGKWIVTASTDNTARVWEAATGKLVSVLEGHTGFVFSAYFSPDGKFVVTASGDNTARVWDAATGTMLTELSGHEAPVNQAVFSPDQK
jgi:WD40 repeat protein